MKHTAEDLLRIAHEYFPSGIEQRDPRYAETPEMLRQKAARIPASEQYDTWRAMLRRLIARFPGQEFPQVEICNNSLFLQSPAAGMDLDRCFTGELRLPVRNTNEQRHWLEFLVSFVVPYYVVGSACYVFVEPPAGILGTILERSLDLSPDELPFAKAIVEEIKTSFPDHEPISPELGLVSVPDVDTAYKSIGEATIFTCLFSDRW